MTQYLYSVAHLDPHCSNRSSFACWRMLTLFALVKIQHNPSVLAKSQCQQYSSKGHVSEQKFVLHIPQATSTEYT